MDLLLSYYRNPIFGILVLISLVLILAVSHLIFSSLKENKTNKNIKKYLAGFINSENNYFHKLELNEKLDLIDCFFKAKDYLVCKEALINTIKIQPDNKDLLYLLAECEFRLGLIDNAREILLKILKIRSRDEKSLLFLAYIYFILNEINNCIEVYKCLNALGDFEKDLSFIKNYSTFNAEKLSVKINDKAISDDLITRFFVCKNCSSHSLFYTPFCSHCFRCDTMQANLRIKI